MLPKLLRLQAYVQLDTFIRQVLDVAEVRRYKKLENKLVPHTVLREVIHIKRSSHSKIVR